jgi:outer membrane immunogenic protein
MRKLTFLAVASIFVGPAAYAADLPVKAFKAPGPTLFNWGGFYAGAHLGGGWKRGDAFDFAVPDPITSGQPDLPFDNKASGFIGGIQIGYNWQVTPNWVVGVEADITGSDLDGSFTYEPVPQIAAAQPGSFETLRRKVEWFGTVRGRVGYAMDRWLPYLTGGFAYAGVKHDALAVFPGVSTFTFSDNKVKVGFTVGAGFEYALSPNWILGAEYLYIQVDGADGISYGDPPIGAGAGSNYVWRDTEIHVARARLSYRFGR